MCRRSAIEPVIGYIKAEHRMGRDYLAGKQGDAVNAILAAAGYNFSLVLRWLKALFSGFSSLASHRRPPKSAEGTQSVIPLIVHGRLKHLRALHRSRQRRALRSIPSSFV
ncbi:hypothetical protein MesoLj131c_68390 (plasmid) [Mesorhizobium sp. 131-3-5]|nr:hypothetical protein MesoLj131c_68390 [Mesorhizobium sp. 131-3-5]